jgi:hypothetical protein
MFPSTITSITSETTRDDSKLKEVMSNFQKLNNEYNKRLENKLTDVKTIDLDEKDVFYMISRAKSEIKNINSQTLELTKLVNCYEKEISEINSIIQMSKKISDKYYELSTRNQIYDVEYKLPIKNTIIEDVKSDLNDLNNELTNKISDFNDKIRKNQEKISNFNKLVMLSMGESDTKNKNMCSVCFDRKIGICLNPCGHTFCLKCVDKMSQKCGLCRSEFSSKIKLFIADDDLVSNDLFNEDDTDETDDYINAGGLGFMISENVNPLESLTALMPSFID